MNSILAYARRTDEDKRMQPMASGGSATREEVRLQSAILMYHGVAAVNSDPWPFYVTPQHSAEHLEDLRRYTYPIQLQRLAQASGHVSLASRLVVVTFENGYANNLHTARALLERYDIPATVSLITEPLGHACEFWQDELD